MGAFPQWMDQHPRSIVDNETTTTTVTPHEAADEYKTALGHIAELYTFLSPILPTVTETERTIRIYRQEGQEESNNQDKGGHKPETEEEESGEDEEDETAEVDEDHSEDDENEQRESDEEEERPTVRWDMSHLSEEEKEKEEARMEEDITFDVTPEASTHTPDNRSNPVPGTKAPEPPKLKKKDVIIREPRRSARPRILPRRYRE